MRVWISYSNYTFAGMFLFEESRVRVEKVSRMLGLEDVVLGAWISGSFVLLFLPLLANWQESGGSPEALSLEGFVFFRVGWVKGPAEADGPGALVRRQDPGQGPASALPVLFLFAAGKWVEGLWRVVVKEVETNSKYSEVYEKSRGPARNIHQHSQVIKKIKPILVDQMIDLFLPLWQLSVCVWGHVHTCL